MQLPFDFILPQTNWAPPVRLPDLTDILEIAIDTENYDPDLDRKGPSCLRDNGDLAGISLATRDAEWYLPIGHQDGGNLDRGIVIRYMQDLCKQERQWIFASGQYDLLWLWSLGIHPQGTFWDVQIADTLLNEERHDGYSLEVIGKRWLGQGKDEYILNEAANAFGFRPKEDMWRLHARYVGRYAEVDARRTFDIKQKQQPALEAEGLMEPMKLEMELLPILAKMTKTGIRIDTEYASQLNQRWLLEETALLSKLRMTHDNIWDPAVVARLCKQHGIPPIKTEKGNDSYGKDHMTGFRIPEIDLLLKARAIQRTRSIYLEQNLLINPYKGRLHPQYVQMACDEGGTRTYRLACKNPNAQQFPKRSKLFDAKSLRLSLKAEEGCEWAKLDYWSQEPTLQVHYGLLENLPGAREVAAKFAEGTKLYTFIEKASNGRCNYDQSKEVVLGRSYGMGVRKMSDRMNISEDECQSILAAFDETVPYIVLLAQNVSQRAKLNGYIKTLLGYRRRFNYWEVPKRQRPPGSEKWDWRPQPHEIAEKRWLEYKLERAWTYKAFNGLIQGGAANQAKKAVVLCVREGIIPNLLVHDELNCGTITNHTQAHRMKEIAENAVRLRLPVRADLDIGTTWQ